MVYHLILSKSRNAFNRTDAVLFNYTAQRQKLHFLLKGILYVAYEQEIYSLLTSRFHKFEKTQSVKLWSIITYISKVCLFLKDIYGKKQCLQFLQTSACFTHKHLLPVSIMPSTNNVASSNFIVIRTPNIGTKLVFRICSVHFSTGCKETKIFRPLIYYNNIYA